MKKFVNISGVILLNIFAFGSIFKIMHWPGANIMFTLSLGLFSLVFLPLAIMSSYKNSESKSVILYLSGFICSFICIISSLFKIMHWQGASILLLISIPLPFIFFLPVYIYHHSKAKEKSYMNFIGIMLLMVFVAVFNSMLALGIGKEVLNSMIVSEKIQSESVAVIKSRNAISYKEIAKNFAQNKKEKIDSIRKLSEDASLRIEKVKNDLVSFVMGKIENSNAYPQMKITESGLTGLFMRSEYDAGGKAEELKEIIHNYNLQVNRVLKNDTAAVDGINSLLDVSDKPAIWEGNNRNFNWQDSYFKSGTYFIIILSNLECIEVNVQVAETIALNSVIRN